MAPAETPPSARNPPGYGWDVSGDGHDKTKCFAKIQEDSRVLRLWDKDAPADADLMVEKIAEGVTDAYQSPLATGRRGKETAKQEPEEPLQGDT